MSKTNSKGLRTKFIILLWCMAILPAIALTVILLLTAKGHFGELPSFEELENPKSNLATEIYSEDGVELGTFFIENRSYLQYAELFPTSKEDYINIHGKDVPPIVAALIATEDARYRDHGGIDMQSLFRVGVKTIVMRNSSQGGGSTITQQLAKNLFPRDTTRYTSKLARTNSLVQAKFKEWITALKLEYNYTKDEIAAMYLNTVAYGSNAYGIRAAAQTFFNCEPNELNIQQAALLVGVVNAPTRYSPISNPKNSLARRNLVLQRMAQAGAISEERCDSLSRLDIVLDYRPVSNNYGVATYFREMLRLTMNAKRPTRNQFYRKWDYDQALKQYDENPIYGWCEKNKKSDGTNYNIYRDGLKIYTTIDSRMQLLAEEALAKQLKGTIQPMMDAEIRERGTIFTDATEAEEKRIMLNAVRYSERCRAMDLAGKTNDEIIRSFDTPTQMSVFTYEGMRDTLMTPRDSILHYKSIMRASFVAMDPRTGGVKAYIGGPDFSHFKYDMAKQGKRQIGSTIKPFIYTFAIDHLGLDPCTPVPNLPVTIETANGTPWSPKESGNVVYDGYPNPLSWGLARSRNNYSAWIIKQAKQPSAVADFIHNLGVKSYIDPVPALCLGTAESNVFEVVSSYATFANQGVYTEPIFVTRIEDRQGNLISSFVPKSQDAISERTAFTMLTMLKNVVKKGTAIRLTWAYGMYNMDVGGKTGTSQRNRDAWFMCVTPKLVAGAWVGGEDQSVHPGSRGEGSVMALPIVGEFFSSLYKRPELGISKADKFVRPLNMEEFDCDKQQESLQSEESVEEEEEEEFNFFE